MTVCFRCSGGRLGDILDVEVKEMNAILLNDALKNKAFSRLEELYPCEKLTYDRWEKCIQSYKSGYWAVPENFDAVFVKCKPDILNSHLELLNTFIATGSTKDHIRWLFRLFAAPEYALIAELLLSCAQISEKEQLERTKKHISTGKLPEICSSIAAAHGIDVDTLQEWLDETEPEKSHPVLKDSNDIGDDIVNMLIERHPEEQADYNICTEIIEFFETGYTAGIKDCAQNWKNTYITEIIQQQLLLFNTQLQNEQDIPALRYTFAASLPEDVYPLFSLLLDVAELQKNKEKEGRNDE